ncbi:hypothetical protein [Nostoc sp.]
MNAVVLVIGCRLSVPGRSFIADYRLLSLSGLELGAEYPQDNISGGYTLISLVSIYCLAFFLLLRQWLQQEQLNSEAVRQTIRQRSGKKAAIGV